MRMGSVYKRCSSCGRRIKKGSDSCSGGHTSFSWAFAVDTAPPGSSRQMVWKSGFKTKQQAVDAMNRLQHEKQDGTYVEPTKLTLGAHLDAWLTAGELRWTPNGHRDYANCVRHIKPVLGAVPIQGLTRQQVAALYATLRKDRGLAVKTVKNVHIALRAALSVAVEDQLIRANPAAKAKLPKGESPEMRTWTAEQVQAFFAFTALDREAPLYRLAFTAGLRRGELLGLRRKDLDLAHGRIHVRQQYTRNGARGLVFKALKAEGQMERKLRAWRTISLDPATLAQLQQQLLAQAFERNRDDYRDSDLVFANPDGSPPDPNVVGRRFVRRAEQAGLPPIRLHDARHTCATLMLENGESLKYVAELLGDREDTVLRVYSHVTPKMREEAVNRLAALYDAPAPVAAVEAQ